LLVYYLLFASATFWQQSDDLSWFKSTFSPNRLYFANRKYAIVKKLILNHVSCLSGNA